MAQALPFLQAAGNVVQGVGGFMAGKSNAKRLRQQAQEERRSTAAEIRRTKDEARSVIGEQLAAQVSNGLEGGSGTALDALRQSQIEAALDVMELRRQGELRARSLRAQARDASREGTFALISGILGAGSSAAKMSNDWAQERRADG
jgi:DNA-binding helix-hairpin-helix protein with protein kinase domain